MKTIENHDVKIFTDSVEDSAVEQIKELLSIGVFSGCKIRVMPDVHAGAGCVMSRTQAFNTIRLEDFRQSMSGIYSETVTEETIDESPMAYKPKNQIIGNIADTVSILTTIHPVFNFKAAE